MKDRTPRYPNRIKLTHEDGSVEYVTWERADAPVEAGTPLNKATLLTDETGAMVGLDDTGTVNEALQRIILSAVSETVVRSELDDFDVQFGKATTPSSGSLAITFPRPFPGIPMVIAHVPGSSALVTTSSITETGFTVSISNSTFYYIAIYYGGGVT